jgi:hypothetical protein
MSPIAPPATLTCISLAWFGVLEERFHNDAGLIFLIPMTCQVIFGFVLLASTAMGWFRLNRAERTLGLAVGVLGIVNLFLPSLLLSTGE